MGKTKTDVVKRIADAACGDLLGPRDQLWTHRRTALHTHRGVCSQCIDRWSLVSGGARRPTTTADAYAVDLLTGPRGGRASRER